MAPEMFDEEPYTVGPLIRSVAQKLTKWNTLSKALGQGNSRCFDSRQLRQQKLKYPPSKLSLVTLTIFGSWVLVRSFLRHLSRELLLLRLRSLYIFEKRR